MNREPVLKTCVGVLQVPSDKMKYELGPQFEGLSDTNTAHRAIFFYSIKEADKSRGWNMWMFAAAFIMSSYVLSLWDTRQTKHNATNH